MRPPRLARHAIAALLLLASPAAGRADATSPIALPTDPALARLIEESLAARPELRQAEATVRAERERIPQAGALPDPVLALGIQNDGFERIQVGEMETSFYQVMLSQGLPWPGKRGLRTDVARLAADGAEAGLARVRLSTEADVRRAWVDLLLARERLGLLRRLEQIWETSAGIARARYESGDGAQSDVLRAQLELNRLRQRRWALVTQEQAAVQTLNRLRGLPVDAPLPTSGSLRDVAAPQLPAPGALVEDALARSPELAQARLGAARATKSAALAARERYPDLGVNVGVMPRGKLDPMWTAGISIGLPVWSSRKQGRALAESRARAEAEARGSEAIEQVLRLRVAERHTAYASLLETLSLFRDGLLVQSRATAESTLSQYRVGKVTFASVLEANAGYVNDEDAYLAATADAQRLAIALAEVSLETVPSSGGGLGGGGMPGTGATRAGGGMGGGAPSAPAAAGAGGSAPMPSGM